MANTKQLVLASSSIYRRQLLERLGLPFTIASPDVDETPLEHELPEAMTRRLAQLKASALSKQFPEAWIIGSDQSADLHGQIIGKPGNHERALAQLKQMQGQTVVFHTALCLLKGEEYKTLSVPTRVRFRNLPDESLENYLRIEKPYDCAGSAKSEGMGIILLEQIESDDPTALIGLPLIALSGLLREAGFVIPHV
ncbi:MAG: septum formation protein Maf [Burkholderiaceae bacterium]|nr:septum formation protein Maf [Burkholderiaceae bacterium]